MKKIMEINGMNCQHCSNNVTKALNSIEGVNAKVNLKKKQAQIKLTKEVDNLELKNAVTEAGYEVVSIKDKKSLF